PYERRPLARLHVQKLDDSPKIAVDHNGDAVSEVVRRNHDQPKYAPRAVEPWSVRPMLLLSVLEGRLVDVAAHDALAISMPANARLLLCNVLARLPAIIALFLHGASAVLMPAFGHDDTSGNSVPGN